MNWSDETKFDHMLEETIEQELERLELRASHDYGNKTAYLGVNPEPETVEPIPRDYDQLDVTLGIITQAELDKIQNKKIELFKPITDVENVEVNWMWHEMNHSTSGELQRIRKGIIRTRTQRFFLLGVETYFEFENGLHSQDKPLAREVYDAIATEWILSSRKAGDFKLTCWLVKEQSKTVPGFWMITVDDNRTKTRTAFYYANNQVNCKEKIKFSAGSLIKIV